ncbi:hypothetical protein HYU92_05520 [Candidatus Curtissbacteria bacterium]|nr:hypothetical protein [Candidatus Curtissbacteria bacterium]
MKSNFKIKVLILLFTLIPIIYLIYAAIRYSVDLPSWVEWYDVYLFEKMFSHTLTLPDLWAQHNEHRLFFPRIVTLALGQFTGWNLKYEIAFNVILGIGIFASLVYSLKREIKNFKKFSLYLIIPAISFLVFSLNQFENWLWGMQKLVFMNVLAVVIGFIVLGSVSMTLMAILVAAFFGLVATYSYAGGLSYWPIGFVLIYFHSKLSREKKIKFLILWIIIAFVVYFSYFIGYAAPKFDPPIPPTLVFKYPVETIKYILMLLGSPLEIISVNRAVLFGVLGVVIYLFSLYRLFKTKILSVNLILLQFALGLYAILSAIMTASGRIGLGFPIQPISRYVTLTSLFWISIVVLLFLQLNINQKYKTSLFDKLKIIIFVLITAVTFLAIYSSHQGTMVARGRYLFLSDIRSRLLTDDPSIDKLKLWMQVYPHTNSGNIRGAINVTEI